jgi:N6-L-threonylcarbamoyladenine synthase
VPVLVVAGGVAANHRLKNTFESLSAHHGFTLIVPPADLCTDNAAMVAWAGAERLARGLTDPLDTEARARWPLDPQAKRMTGAGVKA